MTQFNWSFKKKRPKVRFAVKLLTLAKQECLFKDIQEEINLCILKFEKSFFEFLPDICIDR